MTFVDMSYWVLNGLNESFSDFASIEKYLNIYNIWILIKNTYISLFFATNQNSQSQTFCSWYNMITCYIKSIDIHFCKHNTAHCKPLKMISTTLQKTHFWPRNEASMWQLIIAMKLIEKSDIADHFKYVFQKFTCS